MNANDILKAAKTPMNLDEAFLLQSQISMQIVSENKAKSYHDEAQVLRLEIQKKMGFDCDTYYRFLQGI